MDHFLLSFYYNFIIQHLFLTDSARIIQEDGFVTEKRNNLIEDASAEQEHNSQSVLNNEQFNSDNLLKYFNHGEPGPKLVSSKDQSSEQEALDVNSHLPLMEALGEQRESKQTLFSRILG